MFTKNRVAVLVAEFLGTAVLALVVLAVFSSQVPIAYFVALGAGLALFVLTLVFGGISNAILNPAITLGLWTVRQLTALRTVALVIAQMLGALAAFALYEYLREGDGTWGNRSAGFDAQVLIAEVVGTAILAFGFAAAFYKRYVGALRAGVIGLSYTVGIIVASLASFGLLNPAIAFSVQSWELTTYVLGPILGAIIGLNLYNLLFRASTAPVVARVRPTATPVGAAKTAKAPVAAKTTSKPVVKATVKKKTVTKK